MLAFLTSPLYAQDTPGNGTLINPLEKTIQVIVQPNQPGTAERQFQIAPGSRLDMINYASYDVFLPSERVVYPLDVTRLGSGNSVKHFYTFDFDGGKLVIRSGIPDRIFEKASSEADSQTTSIQAKWTTRIGAGNSGYAIDPELQRQWLLEWYAAWIRQQTGLEFDIIDSSDELILVFRACEDSELFQSIGRRVATQLFKDEPGKPTRTLRICCKDEQGLTLDIIQEAVRSTPANPKALPELKQGTLDLGQFSGVDDTDSDLDLLAKEVRRLNYLLSNSRFGFIKPWESQLKRCLSMKACLLNDQPHLTAEDRWLLESELNGRLSALYGFAFLQSNGLAKNQAWNLVGPRLQDLTLQCSFTQDGKPTEYKKKVIMYTVQSIQYNIDIEFDKIDKIESLKVRGAGWCIVEQKTGRLFPDKWVLVPEGLNTFQWEKGKYCVQVISSQNSKQFEDFFEPIPTQTFNRKWVFTPNGWRAD